MNNNAQTDAEALAERFSIVELRHEYHSADVSARPDWDDFPYWNWYRSTIEAAIEIKKAQAPTPVPHLAGHIDIEAVRERTDIVTLAEKYGIRLLKSGNNFKALCPFHSDKSPSFYLCPDEKRFHCYGCQADGDFIDFVMKLENIGFKEAVSRC